MPSACSRLCLPAGPWRSPVIWFVELMVELVDAIAIPVIWMLVWFTFAIPATIVMSVVRWIRPKPQPATPVELEEFWSDEPVIGWRQWRFDGRFLYGMRVMWPSAVLVARCGSCSSLPGWGCSCGIYAAKSRDLLGAGIVGRVELEGMVIEHEHGYRAERARIIELFVPADLPVGTIAARYPDVTVHTTAKTWRQAV